MFLETGAVRQKTAQRNGNAAIGRRNGEVDITVYITIQIKPARVDDLHDRDTGEKLRNRSRPHQGRVGGEWFPGFDVCEAVALSEHWAIALHHDHDGARAFVLVDPLRHPRVDHAGEIFSRQLKWRLWWRRVGRGAKRAQREGH